MTRMTKKTEMRFEKIQKSRTGSIQIRKCPRVSNIVYVIFDDACEHFSFFSKKPLLFLRALCVRATHRQSACMVRGVPDLVCLSNQKPLADLSF